MNRYIKICLPLRFLPDTLMVVRELFFSHLIFKLIPKGWQPEGDAIPLSFLSGFAGGNLNAARESNS